MTKSFDPRCTVEVKSVSGQKLPSTIAKEIYHILKHKYTTMLDTDNNVIYINDKD